MYAASGRGYTLKAMQVAMWCVHRAPDFEEALLAVVSAGGDAGTVTGAFFGASHEGMGGVLVRDDLRAGFGGSR